MKRQTLSISSFKKFFKRIILPFTVIFLLTGFAFNYYFEKYIILGNETSGAYKVNRIINTVDLDEIAFLGSSRAEGNFIPDSLVKNGFNYGMLGAQDDVMLFFLNEECKKKGKTKPIVINFDLDGLDYSIGDQANYIYNSNYSPIKELLAENYKTIYGIPLIKYYGHVELYFKYYLNNKMNLTKFTNKGALIEKNEMTEQKFHELVQARLKKETVFRNGPTLLKELFRIIYFNKHRKFIFVITPYHQSYFKGFTNIAEAEKFLILLKNIHNVVVLDFRNMHYPDNYFIDTTHLNLEGAIKFNQSLKDSLEKYIH